MRLTSFRRKLRCSTMIWLCSSNHSIMKKCKNFWIGLKSRESSLERSTSWWSLKNSDSEKVQSKKLSQSMVTTILTIIFHSFVKRDRTIIVAAQGETTSLVLVRAVLQKLQTTMDSNVLKSRYQEIRIRIHSYTTIQAIWWYKVMNMAWAIFKYIKKISIKHKKQEYRLKQERSIINT